MLDVTQILIVLLTLVVVPINTQPISGREGPTSLRVTDVMGQQMVWSESRRRSVDGNE